MHRDLGAPEWVVDTGSNRNKSLLTWTDRCFLSVDEDVKLWEHTTPIEYRFDSRPDPLSTRYWRTREELEERCRPESNGADFLALHEAALDCSGRWGAPVALSVSGILGDCGMATPRLIFSLSDDQIREITGCRGLLEQALSNRLIHRQVEWGVISPQPLSMMPCIAFNNKLPLPPFFPMGRNQDGSYAYLLKACLPGALVAHLPTSVWHMPQNTRHFTKECLSEMEFRFNDLLILLLHFYLSLPYDLRKSSQPYARLGEFLVEQGRRREREFLQTSRELLAKALQWKGEALSARIRRLETLNCPDMPLWVATANAELTLHTVVQRRTNFAIPVETPTPEKTQRWLHLFGRLVMSWPEIRRISAQAGQDIL